MHAPLISTWRLVVPIKDHRRGKSRLHPPQGVERSDVALAIAVDTLAAVRQVVPDEQLVVVTDDEQVRQLLRGTEVSVVPDPGRGLNAAISAGLHVLPNGPGGVLLADLPALTAAELYDGLRRCGAVESAVVPDYTGLGTVLLTHHDASRIRPRFGTGSLARHARNATRMDLPLPRLRTDVDDQQALERAAALGLGPATAAVLRSNESAGSPAACGG